MGEKKIEKSIEMTVEFFKKMNSPTSLKDVELNKDDIDKVVASLKKHGLVALGEHCDIDVDESRKILEAAL